MKKQFILLAVLFVFFMNNTYCQTMAKECRCITVKLKKCDECTVEGIGHRYYFENNCPEKLEYAFYIRHNDGKWLGYPSVDPLDKGQITKGYGFIDCAGTEDVKVFVRKPGSGDKWPKKSDIN